MLEPTPLFGGNADFLETLYEQYLRDPASVEERWRRYFESLPGAVGEERPRAAIEAQIVARARQPRALASAAASRGADVRQAHVSRLIQIWINRGHLIAKLDPLGLTQRPRPHVLDLEYFKLSK